MDAAVIDSHQHFWRIARGDYGWMSSAMGEPLYRDYLPVDLAPLLRRAGVRRTIVVQAAATEAETAFLLDLAAGEDFIAGVVGWLDMEDPAFAAKLDALVTNPKFVGLRPMLQDIDDDAYILRPTVLANLGAIRDRDVAFDFLTYPHHLAHVAEALEAVPGLRAVIDHLSKPPIATGMTQGWADDLRRIAQHPNVFCKLSGMITEASLDGWSPGDLAPFVAHAVSVFGAKRLMFGSDWPVCLLAGSYAEVINALRAVLQDHLSHNDMAGVLGGNAARFYHLDGVRK